MYLVNRTIKIMLKRWGGSRQKSDNSICDKRKSWSETHAYSLRGLGHHNLATGMQAMKSIKQARGFGTPQWLSQMCQANNLYINHQVNTLN